MDPGNSEALPQAESSNKEAATVKSNIRNLLARTNDPQSPQFRFAEFIGTPEAKIYVFNEDSLPQIKSGLDGIIPYGTLAEGNTFVTVEHTDKQPAVRKITRRLGPFKRTVEEQYTEPGMDRVTITMENRSPEKGTFLQRAFSVTIKDDGTIVPMQGEVDNFNLGSESGPAQINLSPEALNAKLQVVNGLLERQDLLLYRKNKPEVSDTTPAKNEAL